MRTADSRPRPTEGSGGSESFRTSQARLLDAVGDPKTRRNNSRSCGRGTRGRRADRNANSARGAEGSGTERFGRTRIAPSGRSGTRAFPWACHRPLPRCARWPCPPAARQAASGLPRPSPPARQLRFDEGRGRNSSRRALSAEEGRPPARPREMGPRGTARRQERHVCRRASRPAGRDRAQERRVMGPIAAHAPGRAMPVSWTPHRHLERARIAQMASGPSAQARGARGGNDSRIQTGARGDPIRRPCSPPSREQSPIATSFTGGRHGKGRADRGGPQKRLGPSPGPGDVREPAPGSTEPREALLEQSNAGEGAARTEPGKSVPRTRGVPRPSTAGVSGAPRPRTSGIVGAGGCATHHSAPAGARSVRARPPLRTRDSALPGVELARCREMERRLYARDALRARSGPGRGAGRSASARESGRSPPQLSGGF